jgi:peroxiredoxin
MRAYRETLRAGVPLPPVRLKTPGGEAFDLAQFRGKKNLVIEFGANT